MRATPRSLHQRQEEEEQARQADEREHAAVEGGAGREQRLVMARDLLHPEEGKRQDGLDRGHLSRRGGGGRA